MSIDVTVLRVFTDATGNYGNPLGVVDAAAVAPDDRQRLATELGYSETIFVDLPEPGSANAHAQIFTPAAEIEFAGHPTVGLAWQLREWGRPVRTLRVPAGLVQIDYQAGADGSMTSVTARADWAPEFAIYDLADEQDVLDADPAEYSDDIAHYLWAWTDKESGALRSRAFVGSLGVPEDEATGAAAVRMTEYLSRDLSITQGKGSQIHTVWSPDGWVQVAGRVVPDGHRTVG
ncbi:PhzF family phenazine biosynthesis protein [Mycolicibacterium brumae]|uniref:PhzF family phenazine biosynthesis protein n=1 Tax=Mycolicibacterium brumae TaxID=85968 RepID=A0A2G5PCN6_9MYCO|nr:PhzF family phenazine biosynthesis protein [Mycolicibacterium brumae]MCV7193496.1 PhzF family phenazine biosynthesis protein [Mycolicibacterium brumae]PIB76082.1 PhzF family phenazine biosynthesis protein [Mycolicibacterium brumae]RWA17194.1 hypothetical protein MBRU_06105 [Mycolicibacterium brumae DSM 44177]UWW09231.1 PhzF family phenazine biosynthesis protein [Mycolicibacterium brumae]